MAVMVTLIENQHGDVPDVEDVFEMEEIDDFDFDSVVDPDSLSGSAYQLLLEKFCKELELCIDESVAGFGNDDRIVIFFLLEGRKKASISVILNIDIQKVNRIEKRFVKKLTQSLQKRFKNDNISNEIVAEFLKNKKLYRTCIEQKWNQWQGYRDRMVREKAEKEIEKLKTELENKKTK